MSEELKSCPFCGGNGKLIESHRYDASVDPTPPHWKVSCECIGCNGAAINIWRQTPEDAIEAWNSRHESMVYWHPDCKYCEIVYEFGNEYQCCKHPKKQDSEDEMWAKCEQHCELIETK